MTDVRFHKQVEDRLAAFERLRREFREAARGRDLVAELIAERRAEARREDEELDEFRRRLARRDSP
jgi:hypothetical protein